MTGVLADLLKKNGNLKPILEPRVLLGRMLLLHNSDVFHFNSLSLLSLPVLNKIEVSSYQENGHIHFFHILSWLSVANRIKFVFNVIHPIETNFHCGRFSLSFMRNADPAKV